MRSPRSGITPGAATCCRARAGGGHHIVGDVLNVLNDGWDMAIFFPECTYLTVSGLFRNLKDPARARKTEDSIIFAEKLWSAPIGKIAIENPVGCLSTRSKLGKPAQTIQPYEFDEDASKRTCLWLKGLPRLRKLASQRFQGRTLEWPPGSGKIVERWSNQTDSGQNKLPPSKDRAALRGYTYPGIANAMAQQWGNYA
jgi:hypothetical protein